MRALLAVLALAFLAPHAAAFAPLEVAGDLVEVAPPPPALPVEVVPPLEVVPAPVRSALPDPYPTLARVLPSAPLPPAEEAALLAEVAPAPAMVVAPALQVPPPPTFALPRDEASAWVARAPHEPFPGVAGSPRASSEAAGPPPEQAAPAALAGAETLTAIGSLGLLGAALYVRLAPAAALASPMRQRVWAHVRADPGCTVGSVARALGLDYKTALHHLRILRRAGCLTAIEGAQCRYFVNGALASRDMAGAVVLRAPSARALREAIASQPARAAELARALGISETTASVQLRRLAQAGLVVRRGDGRWFAAG
jgi:DNA-binding transcriptional ArsR family regulator